MGATHVRLLATEVRGAEIAAVADADPVRAAAVAGGARGDDEPLALVADADVEAVIIASSDATHEGFVLACLEAGKPVLCEKSLAASAGAGARRPRPAAAAPAGGGAAAAGGPPPPSGAGSSSSASCAATTRVTWP